MKIVIYSIYIVLGVHSVNLIAGEVECKREAIVDQYSSENNSANNPHASLEAADNSKVQSYKYNVINESRSKINDLVMSLDENKTWLPSASVILEKLNIFYSSKMRRDLLSIPVLIQESLSEVVPLIYGEGSAESKYVAELENLSFYVHTEIFYYIDEHQGNPDNMQWNSISDIILYNQLWSARDWEDNSNYVESAGAFIIDPIKSTDKLKNATLTEIKAFLIGFTDNSFFHRYEFNGDGMEVLKIKYADNKAVINAKFNEVLDRLAELEAHQESK